MICALPKPPTPLNCVSKQHGDFWTRFFCFTHTTMEMRWMLLVKCLVVSNSVPKAGLGQHWGSALCYVHGEDIN